MIQVKKVISPREAGRILGRGTASVFQNTAAPVEKNDNQSLSAAPETTTETDNHAEPFVERFANLQFGPHVDIFNPLVELNTP